MERPKDVRERVLAFIKGYIAANHEAPTIAEIARRFNMTSSASVHAHIVALAKEGLIKRTPNISRGIEIVASPVCPQCQHERHAPGKCASCRTCWRIPYSPVAPVNPN